MLMPSLTSQGKRHASVSASSGYAGLGTGKPPGYGCRDACSSRVCSVECNIHP